MKRTIFISFILLTMAGCTSAPTGVQPVQGFELQRYLGKWYEIARLDHSFERGLSNVTAQYPETTSHCVDIRLQGALRRGKTLALRILQVVTLLGRVIITVASCGCCI